MKKIFKRFIACLLAITLFCSMGTLAMAAEQNASVRSTSENSILFSLGDYGNSNKTALKTSGYQTFSLSITPTTITYIALSNGGSDATATLSISNQQGTKTLVCDGKPHTVAVSPWSLSANKSYTCHYTATNIVSISVVFSK